MIRDSYNGTRKRVPALVNSDGQVHPLGKNPNNYMVVSSGTLSDGYLAVTDSSIGWHTVAVVTLISGATASGVLYCVDAPNNTIMFSGNGEAQFSYCLFNPGLSGPKA